MERLLVVVEGAAAMRVSLLGSYTTLGKGGDEVRGAPPLVPKGGEVP